MSLADLAVPLVRRLPPEAAHTATVKGLKTGFGLPQIDPAQWETEVTLPKSGLTLPNPIGLAAGFDKNAEVIKPLMRFGFGFVECGTVTPNPQPGNPKPRLFRLNQDRAVINRMGFNNQGLDRFTRRLKIAFKANLPGRIGANVGANKTSTDFIADYEVGISTVLPFCDYLTINVSSPNTPGLRDLQAKSALQELLTRCGQVLQRAEAKPVFLKIAPDLDDAQIADILETVRTEGHWLAGLIISNTTTDRPASLTSTNAQEAGGLSGAPLMAKSTRLLGIFASELRGAFDLIGCGGVFSGQDAYTKIRNGAHAVQLYSALTFHGPGLIAKINRDLAACLKADGFSSVSEAVGTGLNLPA
ncbi:MAG: quinone-dependent dihydroorotate dehydrogenase [Henriciella sp.]|nr:quinone-dependent dihydroorotate dehydrogenase [Henriciella sp.]